jgi:predicted Zn-dependent peptidase
LTSPINKESLEYEIPILKKEMDDTNYDQRIYEYVIKKHIDSDISLNTYKDIERKDINDYHKKYYTPDNIIIVDENNFEIVYE